MKKLLILSIAIIYFYGCKTTPSESDILWSHQLEDFVKKEYYASGLLGAIHSNICDKEIYSLQFNGNYYSKMNLIHKITETNTTNRKTKNYQVTETLEENTNLITFTISHNDGRKAQILFNTKRQDVTINNKSESFNDYCDSIKATIFLISTQNGIVEADSIPSQTFTINGKRFYTTYSKIRTQSGKIIQESWIATNDELKDIAVQQKQTTQSFTETTSVTSFYFMKR